MVEVMEDQRIFLNYGPIQMILDISNEKGRDCQLAEAVAKEVQQEFDLLLNYNDLLKSTNILELCDYAHNQTLPIVANKMILAVEKSELPGMTSFSSVAGSFSEFAVELALRKGAKKVIINNGGDIALASKQKETINVGLPLDSNSEKKLVIPVDINEKVYGICTSGLGGRSFTKGIADAVVAMGDSPSVADVCATFIANETNVIDKNIYRCKAKELDSGTDIPEELVTLEVGELDKKQVYKALLNGLNQVEELVVKNIIHGAVLSVKNEITMYPEKIAKLA